VKTQLQLINIVIIINIYEVFYLLYSHQNVSAAVEANFSRMVGGVTRLRGGTVYCGLINSNNGFFLSGCVLL